MSEQEEQQTGKKPRIGGIGQQRQQYRTIGGARPLPDAQMPERRNVETLKPQRVEASERSDVQTSKSKRLRQTVYLEPDIDRWIRHRIADSREEISDVINEAIRLLMAQ